MAAQDRLPDCPKDKVDNKKNCGIIYDFKCENCDQVYIRETERKLETHIQEHRKEQSCLVPPTTGKICVCVGGHILSRFSLAFQTGTTCTTVLALLLF